MLQFSGHRRETWRAGLAPP